MSEETNMLKNPKDNPEWESKHYRRFIRDRLSCFVCLKALECEKPEFITHHHQHAGGEHPRDALLVPLCLFCHNELHANESAFNERHGLNDDEYNKAAIMALMFYTQAKLNINPFWVVINYLASALRDIEENEQ